MDLDMLKICFILFQHVQWCSGVWVGGYTIGYITKEKAGIISKAFWLTGGKLLTDIKRGGYAP